MAAVFTDTQVSNRRRKTEHHLRILIAEDEAFSAMEIERLVEELGHSPVDVVNSIAKIAAAADAIDCALLDVNLNGETSFDAALKLRNDGIAVIFITGYSDLPECPAELEDAPRLLKPIDREKLKTALEKAANGSGRH